MNKILVALTLFTSAQSQASLNSYQLMDSDSAKMIFVHLAGPDVLIEGTVKSLLLDEGQQMILTCDNSKSLCMIKNIDFLPKKVADYDSLMVINGAPADLLMKNFTGLNSNGGISLGYIGQYGSAYLQCTKTTTSNQCEVYVTYCSMPGC